MFHEQEETRAIELLERRRAVNRKAAQKSRKRQKEHTMQVKRMYFEARSANTKLLFEKKQLEKARDDLKFQWESHWPSCSLAATRVSERQRFFQTTVDLIGSFSSPKNSPTSSVTTSESSNFISTTRAAIRTDSMLPSVDEADCVPNSYGSEIVSSPIKSNSFLNDMEHPESKLSDRSDSQNFFNSHKTDDLPHRLLPMIDGLEMLACLATDSGCSPQTSVDMDGMDYVFHTTADTMSPSGSLSGISTDRGTGYDQTVESRLDDDDDESISFDCNQLSSPQSALTFRTDLTYSAMGSDFSGDNITVDEVTSGDATETSLPGFFTATVAPEASDPSVLQFSTLNKDEGDCSDNDSLIPIHVQNIFCDDM